MSDIIATKPKPKRIPLKDLPASAFQHPLDKQATENLRKLKGFDWLAKKFLEYRHRADRVCGRHIGGCIRVWSATDGETVSDASRLL